MIGWVLFFSAVLVPGYALTSAILGRERRSAVELAGLVLALGGGTLSTLLFWFSLTGAIPSRWLLSLIIVASIGMITWLAARRRCALPDLRPDPPKLEREDLWLIPAVPVIVFAIFAVSVHSLAFGVIEWDDTAIWALKAKVVAHDALRNHPWYFHDPAMSYSHQDYPLLMPFMRAAVRAWPCRRCRRKGGRPAPLYGAGNDRLLDIAAISRPRAVGGADRAVSHDSSNAAFRRLGDVGRSAGGILLRDAGVSRALAGMRFGGRTSARL